MTCFCLTTNASISRNLYINRMNACICVYYAYVSISAYQHLEKCSTDPEKVFPLCKSRS